MIPKVIHYIWIGGKPLPKIAKKCIKSWQKHCPDYEIKRWDESNLDMNFCDYVKEASECKKFAFVSDVLRTKILYEYGGIYLDVDVELLKSLDEFLTQDCFYGFEHNGCIAPGLIMGSVKHNEDLKNILHLYNEEHFLINGKQNLTTICEIFTTYYEKQGLVRLNKNQSINHTKFYSSEYFCPKNYETGKINKTENTYAIHHYLSSWISGKSKFNAKVAKFIKKLFGEKFLNKVKSLKHKKGK